MIEEIDARRMPLSPVTITDEDRTTLLGWLHAGAPATTPQDCTEAAASDAAADSSPDAVTTDGGPLTDPDATDAADAWSTDVDASDDGASIADAGIE
jgi:hypothetical protein